VTRADAVVGHGVVVGFVAALGPRNVFVLQQGAALPWLPLALPAVLATSLADTLLVSVAVLGVSVASATCGPSSTTCGSGGRCPVSAHCSPGA
jgi:arginine exporter protein ArgO